MKGFPRRSDLDVVGTDICLEQGVPAHLDPYYKQQNMTNLPQAILIGVQKGGTTALYSYLDKHPDIIHSTKEL